MSVSLFALAILLSATAHAEPTVNAYTDRQTVVKDVPFILTVEVQGGKPKSVTPPENDEVHVNGLVTQGWHMEVSGTRSVQTQQYKYQLVINRAGKVTIPPVSVEMNGQIINSDPIILTVVEGGQPAQSGGATPAAQQSRNPNSGLTWDDVAFVESEVDKQKVYLGEPVLLTLRCFRLEHPRVQITLEGKVAYPTSEGFYAVPLDQKRERQSRNDCNYDVTTFQQILYPTATGELTIAPWELDVAAMAGFDWKNLHLEAPALKVEAMPLPDRPPNFSGAVGTFELKTVLSDDEVIQGTPINFTVLISGAGNPNAVAAPVLPKIENAHVGDPESEVAPADGAGSTVQQKKFTYNIVPLQPGPLQIPEIEFCYFDPGAAAYKTIKSTPLSVQVLKSAESTSREIVSNFAPAASNGKVDVIGEDILPLVTTPGRLRPQHASRAAVPVVAAFPVAAYAGIALFLRRKRRLENDPRYARNYFARSKTDKRLRNVLEGAEPTEELYRAVSEFIADKLDLPASGMTSSDARQALESRGIASELTDTIARVMRACERARYGSVKLSPDEVAALVNASSSAIDKLDAELKKRPAAGRTSK